MCARNKISVSVIVVALILMVNGLPSTVPSSKTKANICELDYTLMFCNCYPSDNPVEATCFATSNNITEDNPIWTWFQYEPTLSIIKLSAYNDRTFQYIPRQMITSLANSLVRLQVNENNLISLETGIISGMNKLERVDFALCERMTVQENAFQNLPNLTKVTFSKSNFTVLRHIFQDVPKLEELYLEDNQIERIEPGAFVGLNGLKYIYLDNNLIHSLTKKTFVGLDQLLELNMVNNRIKYLPPFVFSEMENLNTIDLSSNKISMIDANAFSGLVNLNKVLLPHNQLRSFPMGGLFSGSQSLVIIDISWNNFEHLSWDVSFQPSKERFARMQIQGNKIQCTCNLYWMSLAYKYYDSEIRRQMDNITCKYDMLDSQLQFDSSNRPPTIVKFIHDRLVSQKCSLPDQLKDFANKGKNGQESEETTQEFEELPKIDVIESIDGDDDDEADDNHDRNRVRMEEDKKHGKVINNNNDALLEIKTDNEDAKQNVTKLSNPINVRPSIRLSIENGTSGSNIIFCFLSSYHLLIYLVLIYNIFSV